MPGIDLYAGDSITLIKPVEVNKGRLVRDEDEDKAAFRNVGRGPRVEGGKLELGSCERAIS